MWKYLVIGILLLQSANAQPAKQKSRSQQQTGADQVSPTPFRVRQVETDNKPAGAGESQQSEQDDETKAFQRTQIRQYRVLVVTSVITTVALFVYTIFAGMQWWQIKKQAKKTGKQLEAMRNSERAHVFLWDFKVYGLDDVIDRPGQDIGISYTMRNYGKTHAWTTGITFKVWLNPEDRFFLPKTKPLVYEEPRTATEAKYVILPNEPFVSEPFPVRVFADRPLTEEEVKGIRTPCSTPGEYDPGCAKYLFVYGYIRYTDIFDNPHTSRFAYLYYFKYQSVPAALPVGFPEHWECD